MIMNSNFKFIIYSYKVNRMINIHKKASNSNDLDAFLCNLHTNERGIKNSPLIEITLSLMY